MAGHDAAARTFHVAGMAVAVRGDAVAAAVVRDGRYNLEKSIIVKGAPAIDIYRRTGGNGG